MGWLTLGEKAAQEAVEIAPSAKRFFLWGGRAAAKDAEALSKDARLEEALRRITQLEAAGAPAAGGTAQTNNLLQTLVKQNAVEKRLEGRIAGVSYGNPLWRAIKGFAHGLTGHLAHGLNADGNINVVGRLASLPPLVVGLPLRMAWKYKIISAAGVAAALYGGVTLRDVKDVAVAGRDIAKSGVELAAEAVIPPQAQAVISSSLSTLSSWGHKFGLTTSPAGASTLPAVETQSAAEAARPQATAAVPATVTTAPPNKENGAQVAASGSGAPVTEAPKSGAAASETASHVEGPAKIDTASSKRWIHEAQKMAASYDQHGGDSNWTGKLTQKFNKAAGGSFDAHYAFDANNQSLTRDNINADGVTGQTTIHFPSREQFDGAIKASKQGFPSLNRYITSLNGVLMAQGHDATVAKMQQRQATLESQAQGSAEPVDRAGTVQVGGQTVITAPREAGPDQNNRNFLRQLHGAPFDYGASGHDLAKSAASVEAAIHHGKSAMLDMGEGRQVAFARQHGRDMYSAIYSNSQSGEQVPPLSMNSQQIHQMLDVYKIGGSKVVSDYFHQKAGLQPEPTSSLAPSYVSAPSQQGGNGYYGSLVQSHTGRGSPAQITTSASFGGQTYANAEPQQARGHDPSDNGYAARMNMYRAQIPDPPVVVADSGHDKNTPTGTTRSRSAQITAMGPKSGNTA